MHELKIIFFLCLVLVPFGLFGVLVESNFVYYHLLKFLELILFSLSLPKFLPENPNLPLGFCLGFLVKDLEFQLRVTRFFF